MDFNKLHDKLNENDEQNFTNFTKALAKLSKKYGVAVDGYTRMGKIKKIVYTDDHTSGDLNYTADFE